MPADTWQVQTAKQRFSEVLRAVQAGEPQFITKHGEPVAVIVSIDDYRKTHSERQPFTEFLIESLRDLDLPEGLLEIPPRTIDRDRTLDLFGSDE
ncbi:MAG: type II toxin-antitoxin system Phd/YefM family antitoxin [Tessaracoccus sp.]|uniref:type II toxin-antitoxin system Phd/YefM family antitoxin n=1 Tax=Tessaracoccus sp. TaxID=1971211 RepID=UPI001ECFC063|nr:type II toxin-antitoxin system Phd/YefM family antitoxin [Tessaracoccus sp.]MBK7820132.1 type II toxin-antitoxin system Phd/YefM family antitoxin [Tessaracoccus sp.]